MKGMLQPAVWQTVRQRVLRWSGHPAVEAGGKALAALVVSFLLAGISVGGSFLPLPIALAAVLGLGVSSFGAYAGACLGYALFFGMDVALEPMAAGLLVEASLCIFGEEVSRKNRWFAPGSTMLFTALVGFLFLLQGRFVPRLVWRYFLRVAAAGLGAVCLRQALEPEGGQARRIVLACLSAGLCALRPFGFPVGLAAGCALAAAAAGTPLALQTAVLCGLALDLSWGGGSCTAVLTLAALGSREMPHWALKLAVWYGLILVGVLLTGTQALLLAAAFPGALLSLALPKEKLFAQPKQAERRQNDPRLAVLSGLLSQLSRCMARTRPDQADPETNMVFDQAAERVCRMCSQWDQCWEAHLGETCEALNRAAPAMMTRGKAVREDLTPAFLERCRHLEGFLTAVNRELDDLSCRRQYRSRLRESRAILAQQYHALSRALAQPRAQEAERLRYRPEMGFRSQSRRSDTLSGDRGASFRVGKWFYLLLCDGMGTGNGASVEAGAAIEILRTLLQSGLPPEEALQVLNGIYILRDDGGFATVDLVQTDLATGEGRLFKWGAAQSYVKSKNHVEKIGIALPPPGLGIGEENGPEGARLSFAKGEMLVLVSDGANGEDAERFIRQYGGLSPKELAAGVVACSQSQGEDDRTAAVLMLHPCLSR